MARREEKVKQEKENTQIRRRGMRMAVLLLLAVGMLVFPARAQAGSKPKPKDKYEWVYRNGCDQYLKNGKPMTGVVQIGKRTYYFDPNGNQRTGWRKIHNKYYFYRQKRQKKGYLLTDIVVDGIKISSDGSVLNPDAAEVKKLELMVECQKKVDSLTTAAQSKYTKRNILFDYMMNHYHEQAIPSLESRHDLDVAYAWFMITQERGDCYAYAALFTYLLNAASFKNPLFIASGGHAWSELNNYVYDPEWARVMGKSFCYKVPYNLSGTQNRPNWLKGRLYVYAVNDPVRR